MYWNIYIINLTNFVLRGVKVTSFALQAAYCWHHHRPSGLSRVGQTGKERISRVDSFRVLTLKTEVQKLLWQQDVSCRKDFRSALCILWPVPGPSLVTVTGRGLFSNCNYVLHLAPLTFPNLPKNNMGTRLHIQGVPRESVNILGGHSIGHSKPKKKCICTCVLFWTVSETELFRCTGVWIWHPILSWTPPYCATVWSMWIGTKRHLAGESGCTGPIARSHNGCYRHYKGMSRCTQTSNTPFLLTSCKVHQVWHMERRHGLWQVKLKKKKKDVNDMGEKDIEENIWTDKGKWTVEN
jgi:hypothetical protein